MENTTILAKSSSGSDPYSVDFTFKDGKLSIFCECQAGRYRKFCKHKWQMIKGNENILYDENQDSELAKISDWVQKSDYLDLIIAMSKAEKAKSEADINIKNIKEKIANGMKTGLPQF